MLIKQKSILVILLSSFVISSVLVLTLVGYIVYLELKDEESIHTYQYQLQKINAKVYARHIEVAKLNATIGDIGPLDEKPIIEGVILNNGYRNITDILLKVKFLDRDSAIMYEVIFHPQEPPFGTGGLTQVNIPYLSIPSKTNIGPNSSLPFKRILTGCPNEIVAALKRDRDFSKDRAKWSGKLDSEVLSVNF